MFVHPSDDLLQEASSRSIVRSIKIGHGWDIHVLVVSFLASDDVLEVISSHISNTNMAGR